MLIPITILLLCVLSALVAVEIALICVSGCHEFDPTDHTPDGKPDGMPEGLWEWMHKDHEI